MLDHSVERTGVGQVRPVSARDHLCADPRESAPNCSGVPADLMVDLPAQPQRRDTGRAVRTPGRDGLQAIAEGVSSRQSSQEHMLEGCGDPLLGHARGDSTTVEALKHRLWQRAQEALCRNEASGHQAWVWEGAEGDEANDPPVGPRK